MPINYFTSRCQSKSKAKIFGLCDDPPPATNPAYADETDDSKWIGIVDNINSKDVIFYAIDNCISIFRINGDKDERCDGLLNYNKDLIFVELKNRASKGWLTKGRSQLTATINRFKTENKTKIATYTNIKANICNKQRPFASSSYSTEKEKFKNDTGYILSVKQTITIK